MSPNDFDAVAAWQRPLELFTLGTQDRSGLEARENSFQGFHRFSSIQLLKVNKHFQSVLLFMNCATLPDQVVERRDDRVVAHRFRNSLGLNWCSFFDQDVVFYQRIGLMAQQNAAQLSV